MYRDTNCSHAWACRKGWCENSRVKEWVLSSLLLMLLLCTKREAHISITPIWNIIDTTTTTPITNNWRKWPNVFWHTACSVALVALATGTHSGAQRSTCAHLKLLSWAPTPTSLSENPWGGACACLYAVHVYNTHFSGGGWDANCLRGTHSKARRAERCWRLRAASRAASTLVFRCDDDDGAE